VEGGQPGASSLLAGLAHALVRSLVRADVERAAIPTLSGSHSDVSPIASPSSFYLPYAFQLHTLEARARLPRTWQTHADTKGV
jgi:hypothetical protein